jgi:hypothetical protein
MFHKHSELCDSGKISYCQGVGLIKMMETARSIWTEELQRGRMVVAERNIYTISSLAIALTSPTVSLGPQTHVKPV